MKKKLVYYIYSKRLVEISKNIPNLCHRADVVQSLIAAYNLLSRCEILMGEEATDEDLLSFHSSDYLGCLKKVQCSSDLEKLTDLEEFTEFNLGYDCPLFENIYKFVKLIAGSSLTAARKLIIKNYNVKKQAASNIVANYQPRSYLKFKTDSKMPKERYKSDVFSYTFEENSYNFERIDSENIESNSSNCKASDCNKPEIHTVSVNWFGGWHHAQRDGAEGFCYVNDIVIAIQYLLKYFSRILYIDLDIHHGNGVENAFLFSPRVLTLSIHKYEPGFYPGSGSLNDIGQGNGKFYTVNVPLKGGITDKKYLSTFETIASKVLKKYQPQCIVIQCGADCLTGDPLGGFNLTSTGVGKCLKFILDKQLPTLVLGGGGYNIPNVSRCWAHLTSILLDHSIPNDIPDNVFFHVYGPEFELDIKPGLRKDENSDEYLQSILQTIIKNVDSLPDISNV